MHMSKKLHSYTLTGEAKMSLTIGLGAGDVWTQRVGGIGGMWELVLAGHPLLQMNNAAEQGQAGQVICSWETWNEIQDYCTGIELKSADTKLETIKENLEISSSKSPVDLVSCASDGERLQIVGHFSGFLTRPVRHILGKAAGGNFGWFSKEARRVAAVVANFPELDYMMMEEVEKVQKFTTLVQTAIRRYEGTITQFFVNAKGLTIVFGFGLPPQSHEDDPSRAVRSAMEIRESLRKLEWGRMFGKRTSILRSSFGIATGKVFCGTVGNSTRKEYAIIGEVLTNAASLVSMGRDELLCDQATYDSCNRNIVFEKVHIRLTRPLRQDTAGGNPVSINKQAHNPVTVVYRPSAVDKAVPAAQNADDDKKIPMIGRKTELGILLELIKKLKFDGRGHFVLLSGPAGIGKSCLMQEFQTLGEEMRCKIISASGDSVFRNAPYHAWEKVILELLDLQNKVAQGPGTNIESSPLLQASPVVKKSSNNLQVPGGAATLAPPGQTPGLTPGQSNMDRKFRKRMASMLVNHEVFQIQPDLIKLAPLLNSIIPNLRMPDNDIVRDMGSQARAENTRFLLLSLLRLAAERCPFVLLVENGQSMDSASWALLRLAATQIPSILFVVAMRPSGELDNEMRDLYQAPDLHIMNLEPLNREDCDRLVCSVLKVKDADDEIRRIVYEKSQGNPLFAIELTRSLLANEKVDTSGRRGRIRGDRALSVTIGDNLMSLVTGRIDALAHTPSQQFALKVASVIGKNFHEQLLLEICPDDASRSTLQRDLQGLEAAGLIERTGVGAYTFVNQVIREAAYELLLISQRQQLHKSIAEWYEKNKADDLKPLYPVLALHYSRAGIDDKAIFYCERAARSSLETYATQEAIRYFKRTLVFYRGMKSTAFHCARCERGLGDTYLRMGDVPAASNHYVQALLLLNERAPRTRMSIKLGCFYELLILRIRQLFGIRPATEEATNTVTKMSPRVGQPSPQDELFEAASTCEGMFSVAQSSNDLGACLYFTLRSINISEKLPVDMRSMAIRSRSYSHLGLLYGLYRNYSKTQFYFARALEFCHQEDHSCKSSIVMTRCHFEIMQGNWGVAQSSAEESFQTRSRIGDLRGQEDSLFHIAFAQRARGQIQESLKNVTQYLGSARARGDAQMEARGLCDLAYTEIMGGRYREAVRLAQQAKRLVAKTESYFVADSFAMYGRLALANWRSGDRSGALSAALYACNLIARADPMNFYSYDGYSAACEVLLSILEKPFDFQAEASSSASAGRGSQLHSSNGRMGSLDDNPDADSSQVGSQLNFVNMEDISIASLIDITKGLVGSFLQFAESYKFAQPRALLYVALFRKHSEVAGKHVPPSQLDALSQSIRKTVQKSLALAREYDMLYEEGLALYVNASCGGAQEDMGKAETIFSKLGVVRPLPPPQSTF
eukprot:TRINITY_DN2708_c0_g1_i14.p1 TRINITY_DN2708_c0_g1~~TRINITY_DN2708_c0_g1_i14.p1  ORF type:complete len:1414 (-),score=281.61 TRINITY_DN2708_c0_g1_i14:609-4850(-)